MSVTHHPPSHFGRSGARTCEILLMMVNVKLSSMYREGFRLPVRFFTLLTNWCSLAIYFCFRVAWVSPIGPSIPPAINQTAPVYFENNLEKTNPRRRTDSLSHVGLFLTFSLKVEKPSSKYVNVDAREREREEILYIFVASCWNFFNERLMALLYICMYICVYIECAVSLRNSFLR